MSKEKTQRIEFETSFTVDVPEDTGKALTGLIESFINGIGKIMPLPTIRVKTGDLRPSDNG